VSLADAVSLLRALAAIPIVWAIAVHDQPIAFTLFVLAALSDAIDGWLARRGGTLGPRGAFLDPLADKILVLASLVALAATGEVGVWLVAPIAARELLVLALRARAYARGLRLAADVAGKAKTVCQMAGIALLIGAPAPLSPAGVVLLLAALVIGLVGLPRYLPGRVRRIA
jgi:CDP-diacylglycerol--glycerol-3-phosphate 3-phosphatidyltransferase